MDVVGVDDTDRYTEKFQNINNIFLVSAVILRNTHKKGGGHQRSFQFRTSYHLCPIPNKSERKKIISDVYEVFLEMLNYYSRRKHSVGIPPEMRGHARMRMNLCSFMMSFPQYGLLMLAYISRHSTVCTYPHNIIRENQGQGKHEEDVHFDPYNRMTYKDLPHSLRGRISFHLEPLCLRFPHRLGR